MSAVTHWRKCEFHDPPNSALEGIKVLDLSRLVAGNMTSLQLADFGASVTKVEPLPNGDPLRAWRQSGYATFWKVYGRNKLSVALNFRHAGAIGILRRMIAKCDVMIESFRPGTLEKMGLNPEDLLREHPRLVILRVSGFGQTGPYSQRPGFGTLAEGMSGFAQLNGEADGGPLLPPLALADMIAGLYGANAIMMALRALNCSSKGQVIDLSLLDAMVSVLGPEALDYQLSGRAKPRAGNGSNTSCPRNAYTTRDGQSIAISASIQNTAEALFRAVGRADMIDDPRYATNEARVKHRLEVDGILADWIGAHSGDEVLSRFEADSITAAPLYEIDDICSDKHFIERGVYVEIPDEDLGGIAMHAPVPRLSATPGALRSPAPELGEHTTKLLAEADFSAAEIRQFIDSGAIAEKSGE